MSSYANKKFTQRSGINLIVLISLYRQAYIEYYHSKAGNWRWRQPISSPLIPSCQSIPLTKLLFSSYCKLRFRTLAIQKETYPMYFMSILYRSPQIPKNILAPLVSGHHTVYTNRGNCLNHRQKGALLVSGQRHRLFLIAFGPTPFLASQDMTHSELARINSDFAIHGLFKSTLEVGIHSPGYFSSNRPFSPLATVFYLACDISNY
jgi:hypothetical protein